MPTPEVTQSTENILEKRADAPFDLLNSGLKAVEQVMFDVVDSDVAVLRDASRHILEAGGKRIRPRLVLLSYFATGGQDIQQVAPVAAAVELVHTASVVHDDINDHGIVRRGRPSVNSIWGRTFALLTGDFLFTKVYELMAPYKDLNIILSEATIALVEGETLQASAVKENNFSRQVYYDIIARKTAALFKAGAVLGAKLNGAPSKHVTALGQYGYNIGLAFQITDDILDLTGDQEQLGKTSGIDLDQGKGFASIHEDTEANKNHPLDSIKRKLIAGDKIDEAYQQAENLAEYAMTSLDALPDAPFRIALTDLARTVIDRSY